MTFASDIAKFVKKTQISGDKVTRAIGFKAFGGVVKKSPVDTGRFRANWRVGVNRINKNTDDAKDKRPRGAPPSAGKKGEALAALKVAKFGDILNISNSLPYAQALEDGHSKQSAKMVALTLAELKDEVQRNLQALAKGGGA